MKKELLIVAVLLLFFACTKQKPQPPANRPVLEMIGTWSMYSFKEVWDTDSLYVTVNDHPCLAEKLIEFKQDSTYLSHYTGSDTCWLTPPPTTSIRTGTYIGYADFPPFTSQWGQNGPTVYLTKPPGAPATISKSNGKIYLTRAFAESSTSIPKTITMVYIKN